MKAEKREMLVLLGVILALVAGHALRLFSELAGFELFVVAFVLWKIDTLDERTAFDQADIAGLLEARIAETQAQIQQAHHETVAILLAHSATLEALSREQL